MSNNKRQAFDPDPEELIDAIHRLNGNSAAIAKSFNVPRSTLQYWFEVHPDMQAELHAAREEMLDMAESSLYRRVLAGDSWAVCFFLKTQGRKRGYIERGETFNLNVNLEKLTIEQLERLAAGEHPSLVLGTSTAETRTTEESAGRTAADPLTIEGTSSFSAEEEAGD